MPLPPDVDSLDEELNRACLGCYVRLDALKATFPSLNIDCYGWKVRDNYNGVPVWLRGNQIQYYLWKIVVKLI